MTARLASIRLSLLLCAIFLATAVAPAHLGARGVAEPEQVPRVAALQTPEQFFGFQMGADRKLAGWDKLHEYYQLLASTLSRLNMARISGSASVFPSK